MKASVEQLNTVQWRVNVEVSRDEVNAAFDDAFKRLQKKAKIQGFRPGKAPINVIRKLYGPNVTAEVHESIVNKHLFGALNEKTIRPIASPMVETADLPKVDTEFKFSAVVDTMPELAIDDYKGVEVTADKYSLKPETVQKELEALLRRHAKLRAADEGSVAANGMMAVISHNASLDGIDLPQMRVDHLTVTLGKGELFDGLESQILGLKVGDQKDADIALPADYGDDALAGKTLHFNISLKDLKHLDLPELDDAFAKDLDLESADVLKSKVTEQLETRAKDLTKQKIEAAVLDSILAKHSFDVPPAMVDQVIDSMIDEMPFGAQDEKAKALRDDELRKSLRDAAKRRTQNTLILWHVVQKEKLEVTEDEVSGRVNQTLMGAGVFDPKQQAKFRKSLEPRVRENMIFEKAMNFLIDNAKVNETAAQL